MWRPGSGKGTNIRALTTAPALPKGWHKVDKGLWRHDNGEESRINPSSMFTNNTFDVLKSADSPSTSRPQSGKMADIANTEAAPHASSVPRVWHFVVHNQPTGPVPEAELLRLLEAREVGPATLVWCEGVTNGWIPLADAPLSAAPARQLPPPPPPPSTASGGWNANANPQPSRPASESPSLPDPAMASAPTSAAPAPPGPPAWRPSEETLSGGPPQQKAPPGPPSGSAHSGPRDAPGAASGDVADPVRVRQAAAAAFQALRAKLCAIEAEARRRPGAAKASAAREAVDGALAAWERQGEARDGRAEGEAAAAAMSELREQLEALSDEARQQEMCDNGGNEHGGNEAMAALEAAEGAIAAWQRQT